MGSLIELFHIDAKLLVAQIINFAIVFFVLYKFAMKPLMSIMDKRSLEIEKGLSDAKENANLLKRAEVEYTTLLAGAKKERQEIIEQAKTEASEKAKNMIAEAKDEVNKIVVVAKQQLAQEKLKIIEDARAEVVVLVAQGVKSVLGKSVDIKIDKEYINSVIEKD